MLTFPPLPELHPEDGRDVCKWNPEFGVYLDWKSTGRCMTWAAEAAPAQNDTTAVKRVSFIMKLWLMDRRYRRKTERRTARQVDLLFSFIDHRPEPGVNSQGTQAEEYRLYSTIFDERKSLPLVVHTRNNAKEEIFSLRTSLVGQAQPQAWKFGQILIA
jgi:hypothetical protein